MVAKTEQEKSSFKDREAYMIFAKKYGEKFGVRRYSKEEIQNLRGYNFDELESKIRQRVKKRRSDEKQFRKVRDLLKIIDKEKLDIFTLTRMSYEFGHFRMCVLLCEATYYYLISHQPTERQLDIALDNLIKVRRMIN